MNYLKEEYKKQLDFFNKDLKKPFFIMLIGCVLLTVGVHLLFSYAYTIDANIVKEVSKLINEAFKNFDVKNDNSFILFVKLFFNNAKACIMAISIGVIPFIFLPLIFSYFSNCAMVGMVTSFAMSFANASLAYVLAGILPHGIFEIPAIVLSCVLGAYLCREGTKKLIGKSKKQYSAVVLETLKCYVLVVLPLLVAAAFVEAYVTINIASMFL